MISSIIQHNGEIPTETDMEITKHLEQPKSMRLSTTQLNGRIQMATQTTSDCNTS